MSKTIELIEGKHFTVPGLLRYLNENYSKLISTKKKHSFNINDVHQYIRKGKLPSYCGQISLVEHNNQAIGLIYIELVK